MIAIILSPSVTGVNLDAWSDTQWGIALLLVVVGAFFAAAAGLDWLKAHRDYLTIFREQERSL